MTYVDSGSFCRYTFFQHFVKCILFRMNGDTFISASIIFLTHILKIWKCTIESYEQASVLCKDCTTYLKAFGIGFFSYSLCDVHIKVVVFGHRKASLSTTSLRIV